MEEISDMVLKIRDMLAIPKDLWKHITIQAWTNGDKVEGVKVYLDGGLYRPEDKWIIWSEEHRAWWAPDSKGYVQSRKEAGTYSYAEALKIVQGANIGDHDVPNEAMIKLN